MHRLSCYNRAPFLQTFFGILTFVPGSRAIIWRKEANKDQEEQ
jgi:hypothetical protein